MKRLIVIAAALLLFSGCVDRPVSSSRAESAALSEMPQTTVTTLTDASNFTTSSTEMGTTTAAVLNKAQQVYAAALAKYKVLDYIDATANVNSLSVDTIYSQYTFKVVCPGGVRKLAYIQSNSHFIDFTYAENNAVYYDFINDLYYYESKADNSDGGPLKFKQKITDIGDLSYLDLPEASALQSAVLSGDTLTTDFTTLWDTSSDGSTPPETADVAFTAVIQKGQIISFHQEQKVLGTEYGDEITYIDVTFQNIGKPVTVTLPTDLDSYEFGDYVT